MKHKLVLVMLSVALIASLVLVGCVEPAAPPEEPTEPVEPAPTPAPTPEPTEVSILYGSGSPTTSSAYPVQVKFNDLASSIPGVSSTLVCIGSSGGVARGIYDGDLDWGGFFDLSLMYESVRGLGKWEGNKQPNTLRVLFTALEGQVPFMVRKDSGITCIRDLDGKKFSAGIPGSNAQSVCLKTLETLGVTIDVFPGSLADAVTAMKDGRIVGIYKGTSGNTLGSTHIDIMSVIPVNVFGLTAEEAEKVHSKYPYLHFGEMPAGWYEQLPDLGPIIIDSHINFVTTSVDMPENVAYKITKTVIEHKDELIEVRSGIVYVEYFDLPATLSSVENAYLHPGAIRYYREQGVEIPESVIPPEMK